jgi:DNA-directed RNA polymerase specialized sigma24 family protein
MRQIFVDNACRHGAENRGGCVDTISLEDAMMPSPRQEKSLDVAALGDAFDALGQIDARKAKVVELRFFGRLSYDETAEVLKVSAAGSANHDRHDRGRDHPARAHFDQEPAAAARSRAD